MSRSQSQNPTTTSESGGPYLPRTPRLSKTAHSARFSMSTMDENRKSAVADAGPSVPVFPMPFFQKAFLPEFNATANQMQSIIADVKASSVWNATDGKWAAYVKQPAEQPGVEAKVFSELTTVMGQIATSAAKILSASGPNGSSKTTLSEFSMRPETSVWAEVFNSSYKPDANFILNQSRGYEGETPASSTAPLVYDLVDLQEFKKNSGRKIDYNDNVAKLFGNASNLFFADPSRRFIFGVTIENVDMRLWFFSRSHIAVSESFDFISNPEALIHYAVSLAYAKSTEELGFDPTVKRVLGEDNKAQYQYTIGGRTYQTLEVLSNFRAAAIVTRATRVYRAKCVDGEGKSDGKVYAIKDVWTGIDAKTEKEIQDDIFGKINKVNPVEGLSAEEKEYRKYFMKIKDCKVVQTGDSQPRDYTSKVFLHGQELPSIGILPDLQLQYDLTTGSVNITRSKRTSEEAYRPTGAPRYTGSSIKSLSQDDVASPIGDQAGDLVARSKYELKKQVRVVFEDVGMPLAKLMLEDQRKFFLALADAARGLMYLYTAGYLHRDISDGNILLCDGVGKLSDLEYAIECQSDVDGSEHAAKSGTPVYMSVEVSSGVNIFLPEDEKKPVADPHDSEDDWDIVPDLPGAKVSRRSFVQHYLNDVESLWWVSIFSQTSTVPTEEYKKQLDAPSQHATPNSIPPFRFQLLCHNGLFNSRASRLLFLMKSAEFEKNTSYMADATKQSTLKALARARIELVNSYWAFEETFAVGPKSHFIYEHMEKWMRRAAGVAPTKVTALKQHQSGTKRKTTHTGPKDDSSASKKAKVD